jgi:hypothetical protein
MSDRLKLAVASPRGAQKMIAQCKSILTEAMVRGVHKVEFVDCKELKDAQEENARLKVAAKEARELIKNNPLIRGRWVNKKKEWLSKWKEIENG